MTLFRIRWDAPQDTGGAEISNYLLELDDGVNGWRTVYKVTTRGGFGLDYA